MSAPAETPVSADTKQRKIKSRDPASLAFELADPEASTTENPADSEPEDDGNEAANPMETVGGGKGRQRDLLDMMETAAEDSGVHFRGSLPLNDTKSEKIKLDVISYLQSKLVSRSSKTVRSLAWLVAAPESLDMVTSDPEPPLSRMRSAVLMILAWLLFLSAGSLLLVTAFLQAPRLVSYLAGVFMGLACLAFAAVAFARERPELAGSLTEPTLPAASLRTALDMQQWLQFIINTKEGLQDFLN